MQFLLCFPRNVHHLRVRRHTMANEASIGSSITGAQTQSVVTKTTPAATTCILDVQHLMKAFGGLRAVDDCSFTVARGSITGLIGPNGAGKSTAANLSGGQRRLLELARVVMTQLTLLLLDEPFAGINPVLCARLSESIGALCRDLGITFLIIEHNLAMVERLCSTVIVMALGRVIAEGSMAELRENPAVVDAYLGEG